MRAERVRTAMTTLRHRLLRRLCCGLCCAALTSALALADDDRTARAALKAEELPTRPGAAAELAELLGVETQTIVTPHFLIVHATEPAVARMLAERCEGIYAAHVELMRARLGLDPQPPAWRIEMALFGEREGFLAARRRAAAPAVADGYYDRRTNRALFYDFRSHPRVRAALQRLPNTPAGKPSSVRLQAEALVHRLTRFVFQHETAHAIQFNVGLLDRSADVPLWLAEALAQPFELWEPNGPSVWGRWHPQRGEDFLQRYPDAAALPALGPLLSDQGVWKTGTHQPLAWALGYYLSSAKPQEWRAYVREVSRRSPHERRTPPQRLRAFSAHFGAPDAAWAARFHAALRATRPSTSAP